MSVPASRRLRSILASLAFCGAAAFAPAAAQSLVVAEYAWTSGVQDLQFVDRLPPKIAVKPIYLWMRIEADAGALSELEAKGMLPIRHRWLRYGGAAVSYEGGGRLIDEMVLGVGQADVVGRLKREVAERNLFDWRTWSMKEHMRRGEWVVEVVYGDEAATPVQCRLDAARPPAPCRFRIVVE